jgi:hypothetical protein
MWQVFVDFKKTYDSIHQESLYNIIYEFEIPSKLISLTKDTSKKEVNNEKLQIFNSNNRNNNVMW